MNSAADSISAAWGWCWGCKGTRSGVCESLSRERSNRWRGVLYLF